MAAMFQNVITTANNLQALCNQLGDNAASSDKSLPSIWSKLPQIVVIGGQVGICMLYVMQSSLQYAAFSGFDHVIRFQRTDFHIDRVVILGRLAFLCQSLVLSNFVIV